MEAATLTEVPDVPDPVDATPQQVFKYATWLHYGPGAEDCDDVKRGEDGRTSVQCSNPLHFHAWCRLPNQFQHREIREKALAAKARRIRQLRDPDADAYAILEEEMDKLARLGDSAREPIVGELLDQDWFAAFSEAQGDAQELEDDEGSKRFEHIEQDQRRFAELRELDDDDRPGDEFDELDRHLASYATEVERLVKEHLQPRREALEALDVSALVDQLRDLRVERTAMDEFMHIYSTHEWYVGTRTEEFGERKFGSLEEMQEAAPEVIESLKATFEDLERTAQEGVGKGS